MNPWLKLALMLAVFAALTAVGVWWVVPDRELRDLIAHSLGALGALDLAIVAALAIGLIALEMLRLVVFGRVLGVHIAVRPAFESTIANWLLSWISPGGLLGEPACVYVLARHGIASEAAVAITSAASRIASIGSS